MSFPVDDFGMNIRAEVKAYNFGFSTAKNLASVIRANDKVTVVTFALPTHACFRPNGLGICPQNVTIIGNSRYADQALELKQAYPELRIFLDPRVHAKMTLASSGKQPYTPVSLVVDSPGFDRLIVNGAQIFTDTQTVQDMMLLPTPSLPERYSRTETVTIPAQTL